METLTIDRAAALQNDFMERVAARLEAVSEFRDPRTGRSFHGRARQAEGYPADFSSEFERVQRATSVYDEVRLDRIGRGARARFEIRPAGLLRFGTELLVLTAVLQPFREFMLGLSPRERDSDDLSALSFDDVEGGPTLVVAVLSTAGWRRSSGRMLEVEERELEAGREVIFRFEPAPGGGYRPFPHAVEWPPPFLALESEEELAARVIELSTLRRADLVLRGLSAREVSHEAGVPLEIVRSAFRRVADEDEFLRAVPADGDLVLRRAV